jgi:subtilisin family serine protease
MIRSEFLKVVLLLAIASGLLGQEKAAVGSVARTEPVRKLARSGELVAPEKIHPQVRALADRGGVIPVFIVLLNQPQKAIFERARATTQSRREIVEGRYKALADQLFPLAGELAQAQEASDAVELETRQAAFREIDQSIKPEQDAMEADLTALGGRVIYRYRGVNMLSAEIPASALPLLESDPRIAEVAPVEMEEAHLATSVPALEAPTFWSNGYTGQGQSVAVFDSGVRTNHPAFAGKTIISQVFLSSGVLDPCFGDNAASAEDQQGHGTHVAGIVMSQGSSGWLNY